jgi:hypothetical protein
LGISIQNLSDLEKSKFSLRKSWIFLGKRSKSVWVQVRELKFFGNRLWVFLKNPRIFFKNGQKFAVRPSGYKLESWNYACLCFARLSIKFRTRIRNFSEFAKEFSLKILKFSSKMVKNVSDFVWVQARELKFCMLMLC